MWPGGEFRARSQKRVFGTFPGPRNESWQAYCISSHPHILSSWALGSHSIDPLDWALGYNSDHSPAYSRQGRIMSDTWKQWEGQVVNGEFPLLRYLCGSEHCA